MVVEPGAELVGVWRRENWELLLLYIKHGSAPDIETDIDCGETFTVCTS